MVKKRLNLKRYLLALLTVGLGGVVASYFMAANSEAYRAAKEYLVNNSLVIEHIGPVQSDRLGFDYDIHHGVGGEMSTLKVVLHGQKKSADAHLTLLMTDGVWHIKSGNLLVDGEAPISLEPKQGQ
jgi:hypothetical protein